MVDDDLDTRLGIKDTQLHHPCGELYKIKDSRELRGMNVKRRYTKVTKEMLDMSTEYVVLLTPPEPLLVPDSLNDLA